MELISEIRQVHNVEGIPESELYLVLLGEHPTLDIRSHSKQLLMLNNSPMSIIKCVNNYYIINSPSCKTKRINLALQCYYTKEALGLETNTFDCRACHLACIEKKNSGLIKRKR